MSKKALVDCFADYRNAFPQWKVVHGVMLVRTAGPVSQSIFIEAMSTGGYRPAGAVDVVGLPRRAQLLHQFLDVKHREILPREHATKWPEVVAAMEAQFQPSIRRPLDAQEVLCIGERSVIDVKLTNLHCIVGLAFLNGYFQNKSQVVYWCDCARFRLAHLGRPAAEWEIVLQDFINQLRSAAESNGLQAFVQATLK